MRFKYHAYRLVFRHLKVPPGTMRPYAIPGAAAVHDLRWRRRVRRAPLLTAAEHAAQVGTSEIEEPIGCSLCGDDRVQPLLHPARGRWNYHVVRCPTCGFLYRHPGIKPERLGDLYAGPYGKFLSGRYKRDRRRRFRLVMDAFAPLFDDGGGRRLLDFGCGAGLFMKVAEERGFRATGVDLSPDAVRRARKRGLDAHVGAPSQFPEGSFDVVTLWSVLAHLATPVEDLTLLRRLLAPGGALLILTVNANSLLLRKYGDRWNGFTPNHLKFFAPATLTLLLRRAGFARVDMRPMYGDIVESGQAPLLGWQERRLRATIDAGNRGNMLRAVAYA